MAPYLSQLRKLKLHQSPISGAPSAHSHSASNINGAALSKLADIVSQPRFDATALPSLFQLCRDEFSWVDATEQEARQLKGAIIDLVIRDNGLAPTVVQQLLPQLRSCGLDGARVDICGQSFEGVPQLKKRLRQILVESPVNVDIVGVDRDLLLAVLQHHPRCRSVMDSVDGVFPSVHQNPRYRGLQCFFYRHRDGSCVDFSYARCADYVPTRGAPYREAVCQVVVELCRLFPRVIGTIAESVESVYPHHNIAIEQHLAVATSLLTIARHVHALRPVVYRLLFKKMTIIDAEIKFADPACFDEEKVESLRAEALKSIASQLHSGAIDISDAKQQLGNPEWFGQMHEHCRTDEDLDEMTQKLDSLMAVMFEELHNVVLSNMNTPNTPASEGAHSRFQSSTEDDLQYDDDGYHSTDSDSDSDHRVSRHDSSTCTSEMCDIKQEYDLPQTPAIQRRRHAAPTPATPSTQKIKVERCHAVRAVKQEHPAGPRILTVADVFISELFDTFEDIILPTQKCKFVQFLYMYVISFNMSWTHLFLQRLLLILYDEEAHSLRRKAAASYIASIVCRSSYIEGPLVCSIVYYLFSMLGKFDYLLSGCADSGRSSVTSEITPRSRNRFGESVSAKSVTRLGRFYSLLQDLLHIVSYHAGTLGGSPKCICYLQECANSVCAYLECHLQPLGKIREHVVEEAIKATSVVSNLGKLHVCLVRARQGLAASDSVRSGLSAGAASFAESRFPFDQCPLYHSGFFIRGKYRTKTYYEEHLDPQGRFCRPVAADAPPRVKLEPVSSPRRQLTPTSAAATHVTEPLADVGGGSAITPGGTKCTPVKAVADATCVKREPDCSLSRSEGPGGSVFSLQAITMNECPPINEENEACRVQTAGTTPAAMSTPAAGSSSTGSISSSIRARLLQKHRRMPVVSPADLEPDYDFWDFNYTTDCSRISDSEEEYSHSGGFKRLKREDTLRSMPTDFGRLEPGAPGANRYETSDDSQLIVIGIDQLDDFELSLSSSILVNAPRRGSSRILDILTSTAAYKSAIINSEVTKNRHKQQTARQAF